MQHRKTVPADGPILPDDKPIRDRLTWVDVLKLGSLAAIVAAASAAWTTTQNRLDDLAAKAAPISRMQLDLERVKQELWGQHSRADDDSAQIAGPMRSLARVEQRLPRDTTGARRSTTATHDALTMGGPRPELRFPPRPWLTIPEVPEFESQTRPAPKSTRDAQHDTRSEH